MVFVSEKELIIRLKNQLRDWRTLGPDLDSVKKNLKELEKWRQIFSSQSPEETQQYRNNQERTTRESREQGTQTEDQNQENNSASNVRTEIREINSKEKWKLLEEIRKLKLTNEKLSGGTPTTKEVETQTEITMEEIDEMRENVKSLDSYKGKNKDLDREIAILGRKIEHLEEDKNYLSSDARKAKQMSDELKKEAADGKMQEKALLARIRELEKELNRKESEYQKSLKVEEIKWENVQEELTRDFYSKTNEQQVLINKHLSTLQNLKLKFENREEQIRTACRDKGLIEIELKELKLNFSKIKQEVFDKQKQLELKDIQIEAFINKQSVLLKHIDKYRNWPFFLIEDDDWEEMAKNHNNNILFASSGAMIRVELLNIHNDINLDNAFTKFYHFNWFLNESILTFFTHSNGAKEMKQGKSSKKVHENWKKRFFKVKKTKNSIGKDFFYNDKLPNLYTGGLIKQPKPLNLYADKTVKMGESYYIHQGNPKLINLTGTDQTLLEKVLLPIDISSEVVLKTKDEGFDVILETTFTF
jgi:hypothetical protein